MRIQPRQQILDIWRSMLAACYSDGKWTWGGRDGSNSISDAEQVLCLLYPATELENFALDRPDDMADDIRATMAPVGDGVRIGRFIVERLEEYFASYTGPDDQPIFAAGSYLRSLDDREPTQLQRGLEVVDSYSMSLTLCIAALGFLKVFRQHPRTTTLTDRIGKLTAMLNTRLTAAMTGLLRSFVVNTVTPGSSAGQAILQMLNQGGSAESAVIEEITEMLGKVRDRLRTEVMLGQPADVEMDDSNQLFECGWSWGVVRDSATIPFVHVDIAKQDGWADSRPYLYFTIVALDGINDLTSPRTRDLDLLDDDQRRLSNALQIRWDVTQTYWSTVARYGGGRWPLQDIPWRTSDGEESDYYSLLVSAVLIQDLIARNVSDFEITKAVDVFDDLSRRGRIKSRPIKDDPALAMHMPGVRLKLFGSEDCDPTGPRLVWIVSDYAAVLLKRALQAARLSSDPQARAKLMALAETVMEHLDLRKLREGAAAGLWDDPGSGFGSTASQQPESAPAWYMTERIIECLITAHRTYREPPLRTQLTYDQAVELLAAADHLLNQEMLDVSNYDTSQNRTTLGRIEQRLARARALLADQPDTAKAPCLPGADRTRRIDLRPLGCDKEVLTRCSCSRPPTREAPAGR